MPSAEIITIGTEILLGEIIDTNAPYIARKLRDLGIDLYRKSSVGDNAQRISLAIQQALERSDIVITTGGLGPTVDDPTRQAVALAVGVTTEFHPELWEQILARFRRFGRPPTDNNRRQAYLPSGALAVENPVGTAPAFIVEKSEKAIIALPGVPREMEYLMEHSIIPYLRQHFQLKGIIKARLLHTVGAGESQIDDLIGEWEILSNPTVGLAAHSGQVDVRITAKANSESEADEMIAVVESDLRGRLSEWIYGVDEETLEEVALKRIFENGWTLAIVEHGIGGNLISRLSRSAQTSQPDLAGIIQGGEVIGQLESPEELENIVANYREASGADCCLGAAVFRGEEKQDIYLVLVSPNGVQKASRSYGGPREYAPRYAIFNGLDLLRRLPTV
jgi:nicotinamide-nucleotide amidase